MGPQRTDTRTKSRFEAVALEHMDALYRTALRMARDPKEAEDLVQEPYLRAFRHYHQFQPGSNFKAWIFTILTNIFINEYRKRTKRPGSVDFARVEPVFPEEERQSPHLTLDDIDRVKERLSDEVKAALDRLPDDYRLVFLLAVFENLSYKEIAEAVGCPIGTVMSRLYRARQQLQRELHDFARGEGMLKSDS